MASGSISKSFTDLGYKLIVDWSSTDTISSNSSTVKAVIKLYCPYRLSIGGRTGNTIKINGVSYSYNSSAIDGTGTFTLATVNSKAITHNSDGSKSVSISCSFGVNATISGTYYGTITASGTAKLDDIPRAATITSAPNFNDEDNPVIKYSNPAGNAVTTLRACISLDGSKDDIAYRDISKTGTSYTFNLTDAERNVLRTASKNAKSISVRFYVMSVIGGETYRKNVSKTFTVVNAAPVLNPTVKDTNSVSTKLTGDSNIMVRYLSNAAITFGASAQKSATIKSKRVICGGNSLTADGTITAVDDGEFAFTVTDSRGYSTTKTITKSIVNYVNLTCNLTVNNPTATGETKVTVKGNCFNGSFGAVSNTLTVEYRYKTESGEYSDWAALTATKSGNTYTATATVTGLDYQLSHTFQARATDAVKAVNSAVKKVKSTPIFDWGENDFNFNVPVYMGNAKQLYFRDTSGNNVMMVSLNSNNQSFFGYGSYNNELGSTYFDGNAVNIRSKNNISNTASGTIGGNKAWTNSSDRRLKTNIEDIPPVFADIWLELQPQMFEWNENNFPDNKKHFGLIAQDAIKVFEKYGIDYNTLGFIEVIPVGEVEYFAITYEDYNMLTAQVLKNTVARLSVIERDLAEIRQLLEVQ